MFIYSLRASTLKFFGVIAVALIALTVLLLVFPTDSSALPAAEGIEEINYEKIKTNDDRINFLAQFGYTVESEPSEEGKVSIPSEFDKTFTAYNELQKETGLDLYNYRGKEVERYSYIVTNYPDYEGTVNANLLIYRGRVIGGDISSAAIDGFIHGLRAKQ